MAHAQKPDLVFPPKRTSPFKSAGGRQFSRLLRSRGVRMRGSNGGYTVFRGSVKSTGYPPHSPVPPPLHFPSHRHRGVCPLILFSVRESSYRTLQISFVLWSQLQSLAPYYPLNDRSVSCALSLRGTQELYRIPSASIIKQRM